MQEVKILFVDDEVNILNSLRRGLRLHRRDWDVKFCSSPTEAVRLLPVFKPSMVVSDKRMPEMDGIDFLRLVSQQSPETIRVLLTGDLAVEVALVATEVAHMLISKPFQIESLIQQLSQALYTQKLPVSLQVRQQLGLIQHIPVLPQVYQQLVSYLKSTDVDVKEISKIISQEPVILAKMIQLANSAFFSYCRPVANAHELVARLGVKLIKNMVLIFGVFRECQHVNEEEREYLLSESMNISLLAQQACLACGYKGEEADESFLVGQLHNFGVLMSNMAVIQIEADDNDIQPRQEDIIGAYLLTLWEFDSDIVNAVLFQGVPEADENPTILSCFLHVGKIVHNAVKEGKSALDEDAGLKTSLLASQGLLENVNLWIKKIEA